jgi:hypothetical protein
MRDEYPLQQRGSSRGLISRVPAMDTCYPLASGVQRLLRR